MRIVLLLVLTVLISACASAPTTLVLSPTSIVSANIPVVSATIGLQVIDQRAQHEVLQIHRAEQAPQHINNSRLVSLMLKKSFHQQLLNQGYQISQTSPITMTVVINEMLISLNQHSFTYDATNKITLKIKLKSNDRQLTKTFKSKGLSHGILSADFAVLERIFNQQLGELISQAANDPAVRTFLTN